MSVETVEAYKRVSERLAAISTELFEISANLEAMDDTPIYFEIDCECENFSGMYEPTTIENIAGALGYASRLIMEKAETE